jgi:hypothetical protein
MLRLRGQRGDTADLRARLLLTGPDVARIDPRTRHAYLRITRPGSNDELCAALPPGSFVGRRGSFRLARARAGATLRTARIVLRGGRLRFQAGAKRAALPTTDPTDLQVTLGFRATPDAPETCGSTAARVRRDRGRLVVFE